MSDPRNVAHNKKVTQEKTHQHAASAARSEKGKADLDEESTPATGAESSPADQGPSEHEKSVAVLSKLKEMEFHSRSNVEKLAELILMIEDELKQKEFADGIAAIYSAQDGFQTKITEFITSYETKCEALKPPA